MAEVSSICPVAWNHKQLKHRIVVAVVSLVYFTCMPPLAVLQPRIVVLVVVSLVHLIVWDYRQYWSTESYWPWFLWGILLHDTINNAATQNHSGRGFFGVFYCFRPSTILKHRHSDRGLFVVVHCMRPSTTLNHKSIVAMVSLAFFYCMRPLRTFQLLIRVAVVSSVYFIARDHHSCWNTES